jgi:hypothetical protein
MGVGHVICVDKGQEIEDQVCVEFSSLFYKELFKYNGDECAICSSFEKAKIGVKWDKKSN